MKRAITTKRVAKVAKREPSALERVVMVQEAQIKAQAQMIAHLRKRVEALKLAFSDLLMLDMIDPNTGEVFRLIDFEKEAATAVE